MPDCLPVSGATGKPRAWACSAKVAEFRERLKAYAAARLTPADFRPQIAIDAVVSFEELYGGAAEEVLGTCSIWLRESVADAGDHECRGVWRARDSQGKAPSCPVP